jgi:hypothetical protein
MYRLLLLVALLPLLSFQCHKYEANPCEDRSYTFTVTGNLEPAGALLQAGDTLFFNSAFSRRLVPELRADTVDYSGSTGLSGTISVYSVDTINHSLLQTGPAIRFLPVEGSFTQPASTYYQQFQLSERAQQYRVRLGIIPPAPGLYAVFVSDLQSGGLQGQDCGKAVFNMQLQNSAESQRLLQLALGRAATDAEQRHYFCFRRS